MVSGICIKKENVMKRDLSIVQRLAIYFGTWMQIGLLIFGLGIWLCFSMINIEELLAEHRLDEINTTVEGITMKRWRASWDDEGRPTVYGYDYYFIHPVLGQISNTSFSKYKKGKSTGGDTVKIYYDQNYPYINKIVEMDYSKRGYQVLWLLSIPLLGLVFLIYGIKKISTINHLLKNGTFIWATLTKREKTSVAIGGASQYRLYYRYKTSNGRPYTHYFITTNPSDFDDEEIVIYDKKRPERAMLLYELPYIIANYIEKSWEEVKRIST